MGHHFLYVQYPHCPRSPICCPYADQVENLSLNRVDLERVPSTWLSPSACSHGLEQGWLAVLRLYADLWRNYELVSAGEQAAFEKATLVEQGRV